MAWMPWLDSLTPRNPAANEMAGPYPEDYYPAADELSGDPAALALLREGYSVPEQQGFTPMPSPDVSLGPVHLPGRAVDSVVRSLAGQSLRSQFGRPKRGWESFGVGLAQGALDSRAQGINERGRADASERARVTSVNQDNTRRVLTAREAAQRLAAARGEKRRAEERRNAPTVPLPAYIANVVGRTVGEMVSDEEYTRLRGQASDLRAGRKSAEREAQAPALSRARFLSLSGEKATLTRRIAQMEGKIAKLDPTLDADRVARLTDDLDGVRAKLEGVESELASAPPEWSRGKGAGAPGGKGAGAPDRRVAAPAANKFDHDVRITLPDGRTGTLKAGSELPAGAKVIGG